MWCWKRASKYGLSILQKCTWKKKSDYFWKGVYFIYPTSQVTSQVLVKHDDVIKWKHFPRDWPFVRRINRSPVNSPHKGQWRGALKFSLICVWIKYRVNTREAGDLRRYRAYYDVIVMHDHYQTTIRQTKVNRVFQVIVGRCVWWRYNMQTFTSPTSFQCTVVLILHLTVLTMYSSLQNSAQMCHYHWFRYISRRCFGREKNPCADFKTCVFRHLHVPMLQKLPPNVLLTMPYCYTWNY